MISSKPKIIDHEFSNCMEAAKELRENFDDREWFRGAYAGIFDEVNVIYFHYFGFCPEKQRLYIYKGFPVLMRAKLPPSDLKGEEICRQERKIVRK